MRFTPSVLFAVLASFMAIGQQAPKSATVPITLDHNRIIVDVFLMMPDGAKTRVRAWLDTGNPDLWMTERLARKLGLELTGDAQPAVAGQQRTALAPKEITIGNMAIPLSGIKDAHVTLGRESIGPGTSAEINLPSRVLRDYDVVVDYPNRELTLASPGNTRFEGAASKAIINSESGIVVLPAEIAGQKQNAILDLGATVSFLWGDIVDDLHKRHPQWPHMVGSVGPVNLWGLDQEPQWQVLRIPELGFGSAKLSNVVASSLPQEFRAVIEKR